MSDGMFFILVGIVAFLLGCLLGNVVGERNGETSQKTKTLELMVGAEVVTRNPKGEIILIEKDRERFQEIFNQLTEKNE